MRKLLHHEILAERISAEDALSIERNPVYLLVDNVRSLYNVGSIFRTSDAARVKELILCGFTPHPPRKEIEKTALGAVDTVPWRYSKSSLEAIGQMKALGIKVFAVELTDTKRAYTSLRADELPLCLVVGNELTGLDNEIIAACDDSIEIPMLGVKHSLNVSVATGIVLFEAVKCWSTNSKI